jgi:hypothetical protein
VAVRSAAWSNRTVADEASLAAIRAAVETILPPTEDLPGAVDLGAERHVVEQMELYLPGYTELMGTLLDAYAGGTPFVELDRPGREAVIREMVDDEAQDVRELIDAIFVFALGGMFSEWSGLDRSSGELTPPQTWAAVGFRGPSDGHPTYREDA